MKFLPVLQTFDQENADCDSLREACMGFSLQHEAVDERCCHTDSNNAILWLKEKVLANSHTDN